MYHNLLAKFWTSLIDDLVGKGVIHLNKSTRSVTYKERVILEREKMRIKAQEFLESTDFDYWAHITGVEPIKLREMIYARINSA